MSNTLNIPGWKNKMELNIVAELVKACNPYSTIVEIGSAAGRLTFVLSENASNGSIIYAIDLWANDLIFTGNGYMLDSEKTNTLDYFLQFCKNCKNIKPIIGDSLIIEWNKEIDLIIIDPDDGFGRNDLCEHLEKWYPYVKQNGIIIGYNFGDSRPDICEQVITFSNKYNLNLKINENTRSWSFKK